MEVRRADFCKSCGTMITRECKVWDTNMEKPIVCPVCMGNIFVSPIDLINEIAKHEKQISQLQSEQSLQS